MRACSFSERKMRERGLSTAHLLTQRDGERKTEQGRRRTENCENGSADFKAIQAEDAMALVVNEVFELPNVICFSVQLYSEFSALNWTVDNNKKKTNKQSSSVDSHSPECSYGHYLDHTI